MHTALFDTIPRHSTQPEEPIERKEISAFEGNSSCDKIRDSGKMMYNQVLGWSAFLEYAELQPD
jgi:hypothetical protein